ncbi:hypothetical protein F2Q69_00011069 [Brassica cretica]|uniref:Uncharacterized protein n=1 Tax=Brassica cretica TaxID=69181 RepID=A0A8S9QQU5_BRACR|nr:hypothetical protein F2Q69_00011069 [Brassica cretica]
MADLSGDSRLGSRLARMKRLRSWCLVVLMRAGGVKLRQLQLVHLFSTHGDGNHKGKSRINEAMEKKITIREEEEEGISQKQAISILQAIFHNKTEFYDIYALLKFRVSVCNRLHGLACWFDVLFDGSIEVLPYTPAAHAWYISASMYAPQSLTPFRLFLRFCRFVHLRRCVRFHQFGSQTISDMKTQNAAFDCSCGCGHEALDGC